MIGRTARGIGQAVRARWGVFALVAIVALALHVLVPPIVLSLARKPVDYVAFNAWLPNVPSFLLSSDVALARKLEAIPKLALFWFSASNPYGVEWGFTVDVTDLARFVLTSILIGAYFSLWVYRRGQPVAATWRIHAARGGALGGFVSVVGLSTGPCSVMGCGAPVMPVIGLALAGLSSTTLKLLHDLSNITTVFVLTALTASVVYLGWVGGGSTTASPTRR
jgi:hypothetical protein